MNQFSVPATSTVVKFSKEPLTQTHALIFKILVNTSFLLTRIFISFSQELNKNSGLSPHIRFTLTYYLPGEFLCRFHYLCQELKAPGIFHFLHNKHSVEEISCFHYLSRRWLATFIGPRSPSCSPSAHTC